MKRVIFTQNCSHMSYGTSDIKIEFTKDTTPLEAAEFLVKELKQWNPQALNMVKKIRIE